MGSRGPIMLLLAAWCLGCCGGCGPASTRCAVGGSVTWKGQPLEYGSVTFLTSSGPPGPVGGALIRAGRYDIPASQGLEPGTYRVAISWPGPGGTLTAEEKAAGASPRAKERIPPQYNDDSRLTVEVQARGTNRFDFDLQ
jgi:hypothetical protein